jgi:ABC-2 type transport system permease protein
VGIDSANYHAWTGKLRMPWRATAAVLRTTLSQALRRKAYWFIYAVGVFQFLFYWAVIYGLTQTEFSAQMQRGFLGALGFSAEAEDPQDSGYLVFIESQSMVVMILLAFCGSTVIGTDFREGALPFYLSRRIDRRHYIAGKILAVASLVWLLTVVPALLLFFEYGLFTTSTDYWADNWRVVPAILGYGGVLGLAMSTWLVALAAYLQKLAPIAVTWSSLFILLARLSGMMRDRTNVDHWLLLNPWGDIRLAGRIFFGVFRRPIDEELSRDAALILVAATLIALIALFHRVRAVEVAT